MSKSNMYDWIHKTLNPIRGACPHQCSYCYVKKSRVKHLYEGKPYLAENVFKQSLGKSKFWFIGSMIDIFAEEIETKWIEKILKRCSQFSNKYLFQSKNPQRFWEFSLSFPELAILGTTIESNREYKEMGQAPSPINRFENMEALSEKLPVMVTVEPIMDFDVQILSEWIIDIYPEWVNIGADSKKNNLPEPSTGKIKELIRNLKSENVEVRIKNNLKRLLP